MRICGECKHLEKYHENVYLCTKKKNTVSKKKLGVTTDCPNWEEKREK
jgi:hypothetical protein